MSTEDSATSFRTLNVTVASVPDASAFVFRPNSTHFISPETERHFNDFCAALAADSALTTMSSITVAGYRNVQFNPAASTPDGIVSDNFTSAVPPGLTVADSSATVTRGASEIAWVQRSATIIPSFEAFFTSHMQLSDRY
jgi:hypothetical protein